MKSERKATILVADGKSFLTEIIKVTFGDTFNCITVNSDTDIIPHLEEADAAIIGINIFGNNKDKCLSAISELKRKRDIPIVALTSLQYSAVRIGLLKLGADDVMIKPFNPDELVVRVCKLIERYSR